MREQSDIQDGERPSKSQIKRDLLELQHTARRLVSLTAAAVARLELGPTLRLAIEEYGRIRSKPAQRRHLRRLARLLSEDEDGLRAIQDLIGEGERQSASERARFRALERWRERLVAEGDGVLAELARAYPATDIQQIRQLTRAAQQEQAQGRPPAAARRLFRYLRGLTEAPRDDSAQAPAPDFGDTAGDCPDAGH